MHSSLFILDLVLKSVLMNTAGHELLLGISENFLCSVSALKVKIVFLQFVLVCWNADVFGTRAVCFNHIS
jgi:hypothetical protein